MLADRVLTIGIVGTIVAAICCFTPALVIGLTATGLSAWAAGLDVVLLPALALFIAITVFALWKKQKNQSS